MYSSTLSLTLALDWGGVGDQRQAEKYQVPIVQETWWVPGPVRMGAENLPPLG